MENEHDDHQPQPVPTSPNPVTPEAVPAESPAGDPDITHTRQATSLQAQVEQRVAKERAHLNEVLQRIGAPGLEGVDAWMQEREEKRTQALAEKGRYQELYESERKAREELRLQMEKTREEARQQTQNAAIDRALMESASNSVAPKQVAALLRERLKYDDVTGQVYVVDGNGHRITDGHGGYLEPAGLVAQFLDKNPHFAKAAPGRGGASDNAPPNTVRGPRRDASDEYDASKLSNPAYRKRLIAQVHQSLRR